MDKSNQSISSTRSKRETKKEFPAPSQNHQTKLDLRKKKKIAIQNLDYQTARNIDQEIERINEEESIQAHQLKIDEYKDSLIQIFAMYNERQNELNNEREDNIKKIRIRVNDIFTELRKQQTQDLVELEKQHASHRLHELYRPVPDYETLISQSRKAASLGNYDNAETLQQEAYAIQERDMKIRMQRVDDRFHMKSQTAMKDYRTSIINLVQKLQNDIKTAQDTSDTSLKSLFEKRDAAIVGLYNTKGKGSVEFQRLTMDLCNAYSIPVPSGIFP
ncbi:hypothetical protein TVAG_078100 [Trichomonas vaginalis G3]|uniref:Uncharacterized protein n=1 Tax=Trichomonas vaginalis (strain ATCC PRA-98 / G3) TaxID=412133 RepID=A2FIB3_TRIV3|nr:hypothetical protein TVAGG3_0558430 [Trichomonas vaginalis G3]EAX95354.1 hypothetical protein TVAG_078100 [Trichomonas vaginalis G3]KAI5521009.1 hypothetical protein TVAGG3_0558430 [Trichomonas vaginalis G3]|eukprot:XP_001308284.1 hypothetical protein [Trichomonas vaginalis G3]